MVAERIETSATLTSIHKIAIGWKRIVITVGEKIGKTHLTYGQGAAAELVAAATNRFL
jgi:phosphate/sulfate permease